MSKRIVAAVLAALLGATPAAFASETPKSTWLKAKCALCHGEDGAGQTPEGKKRGVPDLRAEAVQKKTDSELSALVTEGHARMPAFRVQLEPEQIRMLVVYIRSLVPQPVKKK